MDLAKKTVFLILMVLVPGFLVAQQIISRTSQNVSCRIPYLKAEGYIHQNGNAILREMAKDVLREPWLVRVKFSCVLGLSIEKAGDRDQLKIRLINPGITGDTVYRHFPVTDVLPPSHISMKLKWANRADTSGYVEETLAWQSIPLPDSLVCTRPIAPFNPLVDTLMVREIELFYDSIALRNFFERIELIHDYYASVSLLDSLRHFTADLALDNASRLPYNYLKVEELSSVIAQIDHRNFQQRMLGNGHDPSGLMRKSSEMYKHSRSLAYNFMDEMHKVGAIPWDADPDRLAGYFTGRVLSYVRRSLLMDQQQGLIYYDCLDHLFDQSGFPPEENVVPVLLAKMFPEAKQDTIARFMSGRIYAAYRNTAWQLIDQKRFAEAFAMMENGRRFIQANSSMTGYPLDDMLQSMAAQGICDSYIGIASSCIRLHKFDMAASYLAKAGQYSATHSGYKISDTSYRAVFSELFFLRNADCDLLLESGKYGEALDCYGQFEKSYSPADLALVSEQLNEKISRTRIGLGKQSEALSENALKNKNSDTALYYYEQAKTLLHAAEKTEHTGSRLDSLAPVMAKIKFEQIVKDGSLALEKRQFTLAVARLKEAAALADEYRIAHAGEFDSIYRRAMKNLLIVQLSASQKKIWANQFDSAQVALQNTEAAGFDFGFLNDPEFSAATEHFRIKIREQRCRNLQDSLDLRMIRADRGIALRNYVKAMVYLKEALVLVQSMPECRFPEKPVADSLAKYDKPAVYQRKQANIRSLVSSGNYAEALQEFATNQQDFRTFRLGSYGLEPVDLYEFVRERGNPYLTEQAVRSCIGTGDYPLAHRFLLLARIQGLSAGSTAAVQEQLAIRIAREDYRKNPLNSVAQNGAIPADSDDWFEVFRDSYVREWNVLVKAALNGTK